jgi:hypothetical protein
MKIFGICLVKNEEDIIAYSLQENTKWADKIFVYDNGSTDDTWKIVQEVAKTNPKVVPYKSEAKPFRDGLRAEVFNAYRHLADEGDWWCVRCDSDEFYIDDPRVFLSKVSKLYHVILSMHFEFMLCTEDIGALNFNELSVEHQISEIKYYHKKVTSETRFIRHRNRLVWHESEGFPRHKGVSSPNKIKLRHYQYRSPDQIQKRIDVRREARKSGYKYFGKDNVSTWNQILLNRADCILDDGTWRYEYNKDPNEKNKWLRVIKILLHYFKIFP